MYFCICRWAVDVSRSNSYWRSFIVSSSVGDVWNLLVFLDFVRSNPIQWWGNEVSFYALCLWCLSKNLLVSKLIAHFKQQTGRVELRPKPATVIILYHRHVLKWGRMTSSCRFLREWRNSFDFRTAALAVFTRLDDLTCFIVKFSCKWILSCMHLFLQQCNILYWRMLGLCMWESVAVKKVILFHILHYKIILKLMALKQAMLFAIANEARFELLVGGNTRVQWTLV